MKLSYILALMTFKKIAIIGISAAGKSTYSRRLTTLTGVPLFHMDPLFWKGNWEAIPEEEYLLSHKTLVSSESWIIEGYVDSAMANRLAAADLILYLDYSGIVAAWRYWQRFLWHRKISRPELPQEAKEVFKFSTAWKILARLERPQIESALRNIESSKIRRFHTPSQTESFTVAQFGY